MMGLIEFPVCVDFMGVVACNEQVSVRYAKVAYDADLSPPIKRKTVVDSGIMEQDDYRKLQLETGGLWQWAQHIEQIEDVALVIPLLYEQGVRFSIVTSRTDEIIAGVRYELLSMVRQWLAEQELLKYFIEVKGAGYKRSKSALIRELKSRPIVFMDDDLDKLLLAKGTAEYLFLFSRVHNIHQELPPYITRIDSWRHFKDVICELLSITLHV